jgi:tetratricopeptide (TPR) repeat protein
MKKFYLLLFAQMLLQVAEAQPTASIRESTRPFKTYPFNDPNPIPTKSLIYPYFRFDGFTDNPINKEWKVVELENQFIKVLIMPEVGGKIWTAWEKSTGLPFLYNNQVVKFRDVAMRGPWTSGGIEPNYGIIGHTPNCATPVDYKTEKKNDGSVSCYVGTFDKLTQTYWTIEINLASDKAYFTTRSTWHNGNSLEQPYYTWMNVGMPSKGNLEFIYPGTRYIGHEGEYADWKINAENKKNISFYEQNNFGSYKSYHVFGAYTDFFAAFYHDQNFGMGRYSLYDEKPGKKIWIWGLSQQGMIWEKLLTDTDGQYVEVQSGRLFNQSAEGSMLTPFKNRGFAPYATDEWTEYWFPIKGTGGLVKANPYGSLNMKSEGGFLKWQFSPLQTFAENVLIAENDSDGSQKKIAERKISFKTLQLYKDSLRWAGDLNKITLSIGDKFLFDANPANEDLSRPVQLPPDFHWDTPFGLFTLGKEAAQSRDYEKAEIEFSQCLAKDQYYSPALTEMAFLQLRKMDYEKARTLSMKALSIDTYDPAANFAYGLASAGLNKTADVKDAFAIASSSMEFRSAAYTELAKLYFRQSQPTLCFSYAQKAIDTNPKNLDALQVMAVLHRVGRKNENVATTLERLEKINPLSHFVNAERFLAGKMSAADFTKAVQQEMREEVFVWLADWYQNLNLYSDALSILKQAPQQAEIQYWQAYLLSKSGDSSFNTILALADQASPTLVFPYRTTAAKVMEWAIQNSTSWKPKYFLALVHWNAGNVEKAKSLFQQCGNPEFAPFHAAKASLFQNEVEQSLTRAIQLDKDEWRYGKLLANYYLTINDNEKALTTVLDYQKRFPANDAVSFLTAKCLLLNSQYAESYKLLTSKTFLPSEGSTEGHQLYREALLMMALNDMEKGDFSAAIVNVEKARQWPESLGVGKPYDDDIDERLEKFLQAVCLERMKKKSEADKIFSVLTTERVNPPNANLLINALALRKMGMENKGTELLRQWINTSVERGTPDWILSAYQASAKKIELPVANEQTRLLARLVQFAKQ